MQSHGHQRLLSTWRDPGICLLFITSSSDIWTSIHRKRGSNRTHWWREYYLFSSGWYLSIALSVWISRFTYCNWVNSKVVWASRIRILTTSLEPSNNNLQSQRHLTPPTHTHSLCTHLIQINDCRSFFFFTVVLNQTHVCRIRSRTLWGYR